MRCLEYDGLEKHEGKNDHNKDYFPYHLMDRLAEAVLYLDFSDDSMLRDELINRYLEQYVDVSYAFFKSAL